MTRARLPVSSSVSTLADGACAPLVFLPGGNGADVADSAVWTTSGGVDGSSAPAAPGHVPIVAGAPHGAHRPSRVAAGVVCWARCGRHYDPSSIGVHQVADVMVRELVSHHFRYLPSRCYTRAREHSLVRSYVRCRWCWSVPSGSRRFLDFVARRLAKLKAPVALSFRK